MFEVTLPRVLKLKTPSCVQAKPPNIELKPIYSAENSR
jgi:hypothetical protein